MIPQRLKTELFFFALKRRGGGGGKRQREVVPQATQLESGRTPEHLAFTVTPWELSVSSIKLCAAAKEWVRSHRQGQAL